MKRRLALALAFAAALTGLGVGNAASLAITAARLTSLTSCALTATPNPTAAFSDPIVYEGFPNANLNGWSPIGTQPGGTSGTDARTYLIFDLTACAPAIPATAVIRSATLQLNLNGFPGGSCETEDIFAAPSAWSPNGITWANQPTGPALDTPPTASRTAWARVGGAAGCTNSVSGAYVPWDVSADVSRWVTGTATNNGWMLRDDAERAGSSANQVTYVAMESGVPNQAPQLLITYVP